MASESNTASTDLCMWIRDVKFELLKRARQTHVEPKWNKNRAAVQRNPDIDPSGTWKKDQNSKPWMSGTMSGMTKHKVVSGHCIVTDNEFRAGRVAFMLVEDDVGANMITTRVKALQDETSADRAQGVEMSENLIHRQLEHCDAVEELSKAGLQGAEYGEGWIKRYETDMDDGAFDEIAPGLYQPNADARSTMAIEWKNCWNMFRDMEVDDLIAGDAVVESDHVSCHELRRNKGKPLYIDWAIDEVVNANQAAAGITNTEPSTATSDQSDAPRTREMTLRTRNIRRLEFWGRAPAAKVIDFEQKLYDRMSKAVDERALTIEELNAEFPEGRPETPEESYPEDVEIMAMIAGNAIIRFARTKPADRPYYRFVWEENPDGFTGFSVADNVEPEQKVLTGAMRALEDNCKLVANLILAIKRQHIEGDVKDVFPGMLLDIKDECDDARKAFSQVILQDVSGAILKLIDVFTVSAEESSMIPRIEQGQQSDNEQTKYEVEQRMEQSGKYMVGVIRNFDRMVEDIIRAFYRRNMMDPALGATAKGNYKVKALGATSFENRVIRLNKLFQVLDRILSNEQLMSISKLKWIWAEILKALDIDPDQVIKSQAEMQLEADENQKQIDAANAAGLGADPASNAKLIAETARLRAEARNQEANARLKEVQAVVAADENTRKKAETVIQMGKGKKEPAAPAAVAA